MCVWWLVLYLWLDMDEPKNTIYKANLELVQKHTLILDIDGTLVPDKSSYIPFHLYNYIDTLKNNHNIYLCSNGNVDRVNKIAQALQLPILNIHKPYGYIGGVKLPQDKLLVVGDKCLTDGLFALRMRARFIKVDHLESVTDSFGVKLSYFCDNIVWFLWCTFILMRPVQWVKNILVYAPLFFAGNFFNYRLIDVTIAFIVFSASASAVYIFNDIQDKSGDKLHPVKKYRPIAQGDISVLKASVVIFILFGVSGLGLYSAPALLLPVLLYIGLNVLYSMWLKHIAVVDILMVASFYVIRVIAGGMAAQVYVSPWIVLCVFFGALFMIIGKRRAEYAREVRREVLEEYSEKALDYMFAVSVSVAVLTYAIYTVIGHPDSYLIYSVLFVVLALFRVLNRIYTHPEQAESPEVLVFKDKVVLGVFLGWVTYVFFVFYVL